MDVYERKLEKFTRVTFSPAHCELSESPRFAFHASASAWRRLAERSSHATAAPAPAPAPAAKLDAAGKPLSTSKQGNTRPLRRASSISYIQADSIVDTFVLSDKQYDLYRDYVRPPGHGCF